MWFKERKIENILNILFDYEISTCKLISYDLCITNEIIKMIFGKIS